MIKSSINLSKQSSTTNEDWRRLLNWLIRNNKSALLLQDNQTVIKEGLTVDESLNLFESTTGRSIWLLNSTVGPRTVCLKINNANIAQRFVQILQKKFLDYLKFSDIFKRPIVIFNKTNGSLFLIYKMPAYLYTKNTIFQKNPDINFEKTCRLGIKVEYIFGKIPLVDANYDILNDPGKIENLDFLPYMLFPWNPSKRIQVHPDYDSNLNTSRTKGFTIKDNQDLISSGQNKNLGKPASDAVIGRRPTLYNWCEIENYSRTEARAIYICSCVQDTDLDKFVDKSLVFLKYRTVNRRSFVEGGGNSPPPKNPYFFWFCQYEYSGNTDHSQELHSFAVLKPLSRTKTFKINKPFPEIEKLTTDQEFFQNEEKNPKYIWETEKKSSDSSLELVYRTPTETSYPNLTYDQLLSKGIINHNDVANRLKDLKFHPFRVYQAVQNYNTNLEVLLLVAIWEHRHDIFLENLIWLGRGTETVLLWLLEKNGSLNFICVEQTNWFVKTSDIWEKVSFDQILNLLYYNLNELQIGDFGDALNSLNFRRALIKQVNYDSWPIKLN